MQQQKEKQEKHPNTTVKHCWMAQSCNCSLSTLATGVQEERNFFMSWQRDQETQKERETKWSFVDIGAGMFLFTFRDVILSRVILKKIGMSFPA